MCGIKEELLQAAVGFGSYQWIRKASMIRIRIGIGV